MRTIIFVLLALTLVLCGCTTATAPVTPPAPTTMPPQFQVVQYAEAATAAGDTTSHVLAALCTGQTAVLDLGTCNQVKNVLLTVKTFVDQATAEANKVPNQEPWSTARINIALDAASIATAATVNNPALQSDLDALMNIVKQIWGVQ
jgi:hypothetical protein